MSTHPRLAFALVAAALALTAAPPLLAQGPRPAAPGVADPSRLPSRPGQAPPRDNSARPPDRGTAVVRGRVVALDTGLPLRRVRVTLNAHRGGQPRLTFTDAEGAFSFDGLPAGRYELRAAKPRYVDTSLGSRRPGGSGRPFELADGQSLGGAVIALPSAGAITGRVVDEIGDVVAGVMVMPMRYRTVNGERQLMPVGAPRTSDDMGMFRIYGLAPGAYYLSARPDDAQRFGGGELQDSTVTGFAPTYYPGTTVAAEAQPIEVVAGAEIVADLSLVPTRLTTISGVVVDASGTPASGGHIMVSGDGARGGRFMWGGSGGGIKPDGTFQLSGVAPGEYLVTAEAMFGQASMFESFSSEDARRASQPVVVTGEPITGLRLVVQDPVRIPVMVSFEDGGSDRPERVFLSAGTDRGPFGGMATMRDGRLALEVVPGPYRIFAGAGGRESGGTTWHVKRLTYRGREVGDDEVELTAEPGGRIEVVFTTRTSVVTGGVTEGSGKPTSDYLAIVFPADVEMARRGTFRRLRMVRPDQQGRFRAEGLPPGDYLAVAVPDVEIDDVSEPEFLDSLRPSAKSFRLAENENVTLALTLATLP